MIGTTHVTQTWKPDELLPPLMIMHGLIIYCSRYLTKYHSHMHMLAMVHYCYLVAAVPHRHYQQNTQKSGNPLVLNNLWRYLVIGYKYYGIYDGESPLRSLSSSLKQMTYISKPPNFPSSLVRK